ncbi:hypothetical protein NKW43_11545 [Gluconobacter albidus]|uniref:hypothetical protein n=1 Tax=Gluconobacter albidus TaxID=318683 RepID=UPI00209EEB69|nr:hypothetical protein [Gluconobacter albidus]MCP1274306.1 hypothetical protein [Gluconobacter albidus]
MGFAVTAWRCDDELAGLLRDGFDEARALHFTDRIDVFPECEADISRSRMLAAFRLHRGRSQHKPTPQETADIVRVMSAVIPQWGGTPLGRVVHNTLAGEAFRAFLAALGERNEHLSDLERILYDPMIVAGWRGYPSVGHLGREQVAVMHKALLLLKNMKDEDEISWIFELRRIFVEGDWQCCGLATVYE